MISIEQNVDLRPFSTLRVGGSGAYFIRVTTIDHVKESVSVAEDLNLPIHVLGEGSNTIFSDGTLPHVFLKMEIEGISEREEGDVVIMEVGAGVHWDDFVKMTVKRGLSGVEALSAIPGSVGATPFQNVGAYGVEVSDVIEDVQVYDLREKKEKRLTNSECHFRYRDSIFKNEERDRFIILSATFRLSKEAPTIPRYKEVEEYFSTSYLSEPTLSDIRQAIIAIRARKLPDPSVIANVGSFFKNPILQRVKADNLKKQFPDIKTFEVDDGEKIAAGWLIEKAIGKGKKLGNIKTWKNNALVLTVTDKSACANDVLQAQEEIEERVREMFGIQLEREPILVE